MPPLPPDDESKKKALDEKLSAFLKKDDQDTRAGHTIANLRVEMSQFARRLKTTEGHVGLLQSQHNELRAEHDEHVTASKGHHNDVLERLDGVENLAEAHTNVLIRVKKRLHTGDGDDEMATGNFDLRSIQREVEESKARRANSMRVRALETEAAERKESSTWLRRHAITVVSSVFAALFLAFLTAIITLAIAGAKQPAPMFVPGPR